jgi:phage baseplate assembly protein W
MPSKNLEINPTNYSDRNTDTYSQYYKGFSTVNPSNHSSKLYDFDLVKQDILNQFNTRRGQRVMNPQFGTIIWDLLMEPLTERVKELISEDINKIVTSDPRVYPMQIEINEYQQGYLIELTLAMKNTNQSSALRLAFDQKLGLSMV